MRPVSIFSATLCGVLWISAGTIVGVAAQASSSTPTPVPTDYGLECRAVYLPDPVCQTFCRTNGVVAAATDASCVNQKSIVSTDLTTDGKTTAAMQTKTLTNPEDQSVTTITLANGMPLYDVTTVLNLNSEVTAIVTATRGVSDTATGVRHIATSSPSGTTGGAFTSATQASDDSTASSGATSATSSRGGGKSNAGAIAGGVVGGILGLLLIVAAVFFIRRRKNKSTPRDAFSSLEKNRGENSPQSTTPQIPITSYDPPTAAPPPPQLQQPHQESQHSLMGSYPPPASVPPAKQQVEVDEDGVSLRSPTPPLGEEEDVGRGRDYVPRLPIYHRGSDETPRGPAL
ncbi:uncharacterized protein LAJ45_08052 [Morchella importuna]|uniref:uncharacterized protein n=1 Tax=Morchella importuna TaxID=1174673 RepID=UPI001E8E3668|nr:uncharacterized protein LAJ45_08052 [Morchella importuna]KAH8147951.1 hypothetical protein LAJ45_08052 [Morchella importuna]